MFRRYFIVLLAVLFYQSMGTLRSVCAEDAVARKIEVAQNLYKAEAYAEAVTVLDDVIKSGDKGDDTQRAFAFALRGFCRWNLKLITEARTDFNDAVRIQKTVKDGKDNLAHWLTTRSTLAGLDGDYKSQIEDLKQVVELAPAAPEANNNLAWALATCRKPEFHDGILAVHCATRAVTATEFKNPRIYDTLAAAFARAGRYDLATEWQEKAISHPEVLKTNDANALKGYARRLKLYKEKKPYTEDEPSSE
jgi:tetratricopeptide (TPR) repeat protein